MVIKITYIINDIIKWDTVVHITASLKSYTFVVLKEGTLGETEECHNGQWAQSIHADLIIEGAVWITQLHEIRTL